MAIIARAALKMKDVDRSWYKETGGKTVLGAWNEKVIAPTDIVLLQDIAQKKNSTRFGKEENFC